MTLFTLTLQLWGLKRHIPMNTNICNPQTKIRISIAAIFIFGVMMLLPAVISASSDTAKQMTSNQSVKPNRLINESIRLRMIRFLRTGMD
jgi:hypothetical protein